MVIDTEWTCFPVCPYCGLSDHDWWENTELQNDGDESEVMCGKCGKEYNIAMSVSVRFNTAKLQKEEG